MFRSDACCMSRSRLPRLSQLTDLRNLLPTQGLRARDLSWAGVAVDRTLSVSRETSSPVSRPRGGRSERKQGRPQWLFVYGTALMGVADTSESLVEAVDGCWCAVTGQRQTKEWSRWPAPVRYRFLPERNIELSRPADAKPCSDSFCADASLSRNA